MSPSGPVVDAALLTVWCSEQLGSPPAAELFRSGFLSAVTGVRLADGREVVVKVRPASPRLAACVEVQRRLFESGYPCPEPLSDPVPFGDRMATAEAYVPGGSALPEGPDVARRFAAAFALLIRLAPRPDEVGTLEPPPSWAAWNHARAGLWPRPEDGVDVNGPAGPEWIDRAGRCARDRLRDAGASPTVIGHCDWLVGNLSWNGDKLLVVYDWDSAATDSEAVLAGFAAALYSTASTQANATIAETEQFLAAYCDARGRDFSSDELQRAWAAGVWTRLYDAKYMHVVGQPPVSLSEADTRERLRRAGLG